MTITLQDSLGLLADLSEDVSQKLFGDSLMIVFSTSELIDFVLNTSSSTPFRLENLDLTYTSIGNKLVYNAATVSTYPDPIELGDEDMASLIDRKIIKVDHLKCVNYVPLFLLTHSQFIKKTTFFMKNVDVYDDETPIINLADSIADEIIFRLHDDDDVVSILSETLLGDLYRRGITFQYDADEFGTEELLFNSEQLKNLAPKIQEGITLEYQYSLEIDFSRPYIENIMEFSNYVELKRAHENSIYKVQPQIALIITIEPELVAPGERLLEPLLDMIGISLIVHVTVKSNTSTGTSDPFQWDLKFIGKLKNVKSLYIDSNVECSVDTFGDLRNLKKLKRVDILRSLIHHDYTFNYLPKQVEDLRINYSIVLELPKNDRFKVTPSAKRLEVTITRGDFRPLDMNLFDFSEAVSLDEITVRQYNEDPDLTIIVQNDIPRTLKRFLFISANPTFTYTFMNGDGTISPNLNGIYSNASIKGMKCGSPSNNLLKRWLLA